MTMPAPVLRSTHLCVLIHGLWGNPGHLKYMTTSFRGRFSEDEVHVLVPKTNSGNFTYDGIEVGAERVTKEIEDEIALLKTNGVNVTKLSVVGYSLGGVVGRFAVGLLYHKGYFDKIKPMSFTTFATPHLGVRSPLRGVANHLWNVIGARTLSITGQQLFIIDKFRDTDRPLLAVMCDPTSVFMKGLGSFQTRTLYSNIVHDRSAVFYTTSMSRTDPFADLSRVKINYLPNFAPVLVDIDNPVSPKASSLPSPTPSGSPWKDTRSTLLRLRLGLFFAFFLPIGTSIFLLNAAIQYVMSSQRIRAHATGNAYRSYEVPLVMARMRETMEGIRERAEEVFEQVNSSQENQYLADGEDEEQSLLGNGEENGQKGEVKVDEYTKVGKMEFPTLALTPSQFAMIQAMEDLGWTKYPVHINKATHSHAAIIVRTNRESFDEGKLVLGHFLDRFKV